MFYCNLGPERPKLIPVLGRKEQIRHPEKMALGMVVMKTDEVFKSKIKEGYLGGLVVQASDS